MKTNLLPWRWHWSGPDVWSYGVTAAAQGSAVMCVVTPELNGSAGLQPAGKRRSQPPLPAVLRCAFLCHSRIFSEKAPSPKALHRSRCNSWFHCVATQRKFPLLSWSNVTFSYFSLKTLQEIRACILLSSQKADK